MIELDQVSKVYNQGKASHMIALHDLTLQLEPLETTVIIGKSGSGKSTLLSLIGGLTRPTTGRIRLNGEIISNLPDSFLTEIRRKEIGFIFQRFNLIRGLSVRDNVVLPAYPLGSAPRTLIKRAEELLDSLSLGHKIHEPVEYLSGGESQRVAIARALINDPPLLLADEPTANLDGQLTDQFLAILADLKAQGRTIIMTSHDPAIWRASIVDRVLSLEDGVLIAPYRAQEQV